MRKFLKESALGVLMIVTVAGLCYFAVMGPSATAALPAARAFVSHPTDCPVCRLPLHGQGPVGSKLGPESNTSADAAEATHAGTAEK
jgi:hypothetical protein